MSARTFARLRSAVAGTVQRVSLRTLLMVVIPVVVAVIGLFFYLASGRYVSTDNAILAHKRF